MMIRKLIKEDRSELKRIIIDTEHFNDDEVNVAMELVDVYLSDEDEHGDYIIQVFVSDDTNSVEGYICYGKRPLTESTYDLYWIAVDPKIHGKGIGKQLVKYMEEDLKSAGGNLILIETSGKAQYEGERKFYEKCAYEVQTVIKDFYRSGDDLFVFRKYLQNN
jgi:GNAT superfamily N-acetyltransferase